MPTNLPLMNTWASECPLHISAPQVASVLPEPGLVVEHVRGVGAAMVRRPRVRHLGGAVGDLDRARSAGDGAAGHARGGGAGEGCAAHVPASGFMSRSHWYSTASTWSRCSPRASAG